MRAIGVMRIFKGIAVVAAAVAAYVVATPAQADWRWRCGYDRYGYHRPNYRDCDPEYRERYDGYRGFGSPRYNPSYPVNGYYELPLYGARVGHRCYYDHAWTNVVLVCY